MFGVRKVEAQLFSISQTRLVFQYFCLRIYMLQNRWFDVLRLVTEALGNLEKQITSLKNTS